MHLRGRARWTGRSARRVWSRRCPATRGHARGEAPEACQKRCWAELTREVAGETVRAQDQVFQHLRDEVAQRRTEIQTLVHLGDGQASLEQDRKAYLPRHRKTVDILDLLHVNPCLREAAHLFHAEGSDGATAFVGARMLLVLQGRGQAGGRRPAPGRGHAARPRGHAARPRGPRGLREAVRVPGAQPAPDGTTARHLRAGYPIATRRDREGACRHVIRDRMERGRACGGRRPGAEANAGAALPPRPTATERRSSALTGSTQRTERLYTPMRRFSAAAA